MASVGVPPFRFRYLLDAPIVDVNAWPRLGGNVNGPSLIRAPDWLDNAPARYLLYFAHHRGDSIRLATSDNLLGPWHLHDRDPVTLAESLFATEAPRDEELDEEALDYIARGADGNYPHIASPDAWVDHERRQIRLYYHGRLQNGLQRSRVAVSADGLRFRAQENVIALPYLRLFRHRGWFYGISMPAQLYRSRDGLGDFKSGPRLTDDPIRHHTPFRFDNDWYLVWSRVGDCPERLLISRLLTDSDWLDWKLGQTFELHRAGRPWEGADLPARRSVYGEINERVNQLRDPAIFVEDDRIYLLYSVAGEQGIAIGELEYRRQPL